MISTKYGKMNVIAADQFVSYSLSLYGEWAGDELEFLSKLVKPGMHVLDIGAFIGTHTLAFASFVGATGSVLSFEPRKEIFNVLCSNIKANDFLHVRALNMGLAEKVGTLELDKIDVNESVNFGGLSIDDFTPKSVENTYEVDISTVDSLGLPVIDFMKLDVEGMERKVLEGAVAVILKDQPLIFCECNSVASGYEILEFCKPLSYRVFGLLSPAYNSKNFNGVAQNIFGDALEVSLLLVPESKMAALDFKTALRELFEIKELEDFLLPMLHKPQYAEEVLANTNSATALGLLYPSPLVQKLKEEHYLALESASTALAEKSDEVNSLNARLSELESLKDQLSIESGQRQQQVYALHADIQELLGSTSWRVTTPLRTAAASLYKLRKLYSVIRLFAERNPGLAGFKKLCKVALAEFRSGGISAVVGKVRMFRKVASSPIEDAKVEVRRNADEIRDLVQAIEAKKLIIGQIIFDHDGGGGSNLYTAQLIASTVTDDISILRVYCWGGDWYVQLRNNAPSNNSLYRAETIDELFNCLTVCAPKIITVNSFYGYKKIDRVVDSIISLKSGSDCLLDFKVHDFHALCPSPHLSDYEQKYCGIPDDTSRCEKCLPKNVSWYHTWFDVDDMATDINQWRKPFQQLFDACDVITCFDESSINLLKTKFTVGSGKISVVPHVLQHLYCSRKLKIPEGLSIGIIGTLSHIKGGDVVKELCAHIDEENLGVPVTVIGESYTQLPPSAVVHGRYSPEELPDLIESLGVSVVFMASIVPETFSYTISEVIEMGLPLVAFDIGAQGRRVNQYPLGKTVPVGASPEMILSAAKSIYKVSKE